MWLLVLTFVSNIVNSKAILVFGNHYLFSFQEPDPDLVLLRIEQAVRHEVKRLQALKVSNDRWKVFPAFFCKQSQLTRTHTMAQYFEYCIKVTDISPFFYGFIWMFFTVLPPRIWWGGHFWMLKGVKMAGIGSVGSFEFLVIF